jgi:predicted nucleic acid-binding protein
VAAKSSDFTLDGDALLAYLEGEKGRPRIKELLHGAESGECTLYLSLINLGEVLYITERERGHVTALRTLSAINQLPLHVVPVSRTKALAAAHIKACYPISHADAFAAATALEYRCTLLTGDPEFRAIADNGLILIEWLSR